jgi:hypothetical protein
MGPDSPNTHRSVKLIHGTTDAKNQAGVWGGVVGGVALV